MPVSRNRKKKKKKKTKAKAGSAFEKFVASTIQAMDSTVKVHPHHWEEGPDGDRDMDVLIEGILSDSPHKILIECKDFDRKKTGPVGINFVDALDSKRHDLDVDSAIICSNSGFTDPAIRKAKRKKIGLVSIVKAGDPHVKNVIQEEVYIRNVNVISANISLVANQQKDTALELIEYSGLPLMNWIWNKMAITIQFSINTEWFAQTVTIDADLGIYDYLRGRIRLPPNNRKYQLKDLKFVNHSIVDGGKPIYFIPNKEQLGLGSLKPYEEAIGLLEIKGLNSVEKSLVPNIDDLIVPEDLKLDLSFNEELLVYTNLPS